MRRIGQYQVFEEIGRGSGGIVYRGLDPALSRDLAIKELRLSHLSPDEIPEARQRFVREAQSLANLRHHNIVTLYHFIEEEDSLYLVMEFVRGGSLRKLISGATPPTTREALGIVHQVAAALDRAHANGIVHRDIKPDNILISDDWVRTGPLVKVTDFGIARISSRTMTITGMSLGTPAYMAPEQINGSKVNARADQFSLGVVAYQLLGRRLPFSGHSDQALMFQIVNAEPAPLLEANPNLPPQVDHVIRRALAKHPDQRFASCGAFADALEHALSPPEPATRRTVLPKSGINNRSLAAIGALLAVASAMYIWWSASLHPPQPGTWQNPQDGLVYVRIPAGNFMMGCSPGDSECDDVEKPARNVAIARGFWLGQTEVTQVAYRRVTGQNPSKFKGDNLPVERISWDDAKSYCEKVGGRLPTEKEWEYAARAGSAGPIYGGLNAIAWYDGNSGGTTHPVGIEQANAYRLYDMLGNVWEWTADSYDAGGKVVRGGSWGSTIEYIRASARDGFEITYRKSSLGLRCGGDWTPRPPREVP
jgi:serine/threonine protein kinase